VPSLTTAWWNAGCAVRRSSSGRDGLRFVIRRILGDPQITTMSSTSPRASWERTLLTSWCWRNGRWAPAWLMVLADYQTGIAGRRFRTSRPSLT